MMDFNQIKDRQGERGNVLFLILIAVALFAALSYAVTQSTRSGAGDTASETDLISSAQLTQYPAGIRTSVVRQLIGGVSLDELLFNSPSAFGAGKVIDTDAEYRRAVFHPQGGNATYQYAPLDVVTDRVAPNPPGTWFYNANIQIQNIGMTLTTGGASSGNDLVAFLPYISRGVCQRLNDEVGLGRVIPVAANVTLAHITTNLGGTDSTEPVSPSTNFPDATTGGGPILGVTGGSDVALIGQPFACFTTSGTPAVNVYYHVLVER